MDMQAFVDAIGAAGKASRSNYHVTLGGIVERLAQLPGELVVVFQGKDFGPSELDSYRGYYSDLAFDPAGKQTTVEEVLTLCRDALGKTFEGYKGGDFVMAEDTSLWVSSYGACSGIAVVDLRQDGDSIVLVTKNLDD